MPRAAVKTLRFWALIFALARAPIVGATGAEAGETAEPPRSRKTAPGYGCELKEVGKPAVWSKSLKSRKACKKAGGRWAKLPALHADPKAAKDRDIAPPTLPATKGSKP